MDNPQGIEHVVSRSHLLRYSTPVMISLIAQNLIGVVDTAFLTRLGVVELGGAAMASLVYFSIYTIGFGLASSTQIMISHKFGGGKVDEIGKILGQSILLLLIAAVGIVGISLPGGRWIFNHLLKSQDVAFAASEYWTYRSFGFIFGFVSATFRSFFVGITNTKVLTYNSIVMSVVNIILDYGLIFGNLGLPALGVKGAGIASVIAEGSSVLFYIIYIYSKVDRNKFGLQHRTIFRWEGQIAKRLLSLSYYLMLQALLSQSVWAIFFFMIESLGEQQLGVASIVRSIYLLLFIPIISYCTTVRTSVGQLIGAGLDHLLHKYLWMAVRVSLLTTFCIVLIIFLLPQLALRIFTEDPILIQDSIPSLRVLCGALLASSVGSVYFSAVSGSGDTKMVFKLELFNIFFYLGYSALMVYLLKAPVAGCFSVEPIYYCTIGVMSYLYIKGNKWKNKFAF